MDLHIHAPPGITHTIIHTAGTVFANACSFMVGVTHILINATTYGTIITIIEHIPLWLDIAFISVILYFRYQDAKKNGKTPF